MKVFISWSGKLSNDVALLLKEFVSNVIQVIEPWMSQDDIQHGTVWFSKITEELKATQIGVVCLTKENIDKPWILFESGALVNKVGEGKLLTLLINLEHSDVFPPLSQFNLTDPDKEGFFKMFKSLNSSLSDSRLEDGKLETSFNAHWDKFYIGFNEVVKNSSNVDALKKRTQPEILGEVLNVVRSIEKRVVKIENKNKQFVLDKIKKCIDAGMSDDQIMIALNEGVDAEVGVDEKKEQPYAFEIMALRSGYTVQ